jgi:nuclear mRNA export protein SAC3
MQIDCFERIARFHILSLHQMSRKDIDNKEYSHQQDHEQLSKTLMSLKQFYEECRDRKVSCKNEAEFRAYLVIDNIKDPDIEREAQLWPMEIFDHPRVQAALKLYAAAQNVHDAHGPLLQAPTNIAQNFFTRFWTLIKGPNVPYLLACLAETHFNNVRKMALLALRGAYRTKANPQDWTLEELTAYFGCDTNDEVEIFCEAYKFQIGERDDNGEPYLMLGSFLGPLEGIVSKFS